MKKIDATNGPIIKLLLLYTIPLVLSTLLQSMFDIADKAVLGNMAGSLAVASIGATGTVITLVINGAVGLSAGTTIVLTRLVGQKDSVKIRETVDTSIISAAVLGIIIAAIGILVAPAFLTATNCPEECFDNAVLYMRICIGGAPATLLYNYGSAILRSFGDTERPLTYIAISGAANVVLNVILCLILPEKVAAVAIATVVSNLISAVLVLRRIFFSGDVAGISLTALRFKLQAFLRILRFGIPSAISSLMLPIGNLQITSAVNSLGVDVVAGNSASISVYNIASAFHTNFGIAATTFMGQNIGAGNVERVRSSLRNSLILSVLISGSLGVLLYHTGELWLGLILGFDAKAAIAYGVSRLSYVSQFVFIAAINGVLSHALQAYGYPTLTSITNIAFHLGFRILWMQFVYPLRPEYSTILQCFLVSWTLNMLFYAIFTAVVHIRYVKYGICKKI